jgi:dephospho-CoA kinase
MKIVLLGYMGCGKSVVGDFLAKKLQIKHYDLDIEIEKISKKSIKELADILKEIDPLTATLLYRKLMEPILTSAKSKYYNYAAKDLISCQELSRKIVDWKNHQDHSQFLLNLQEANKRKVSFWSEYNIAMQKYMTRKQKT